MSAGGSISDDYVAELLKKDAKDTNIRFSAFGLQSILPTRPTTAAPKPNTRFLRNIIRETDNHNASLLARETEQSRSRLRALRENEEGYRSSERRRNKDSLSDGHYEEIRRRKRRRLEDDERHRRHSHHRDDEDKYQTRRRERGEERIRDLDVSPSTRRRAKKLDDASSSDDRDIQRGRSSSPKRRRRYRSVSPEYTSEDHSRRHRSRRHHRKRHRSRTRSPSERERTERHRHHRHRRRRHGSRSDSPRASDRRSPRGDGRSIEPEQSSSNRRTQDEAHSDSDPLEAIIGPPPPPPEATVRPRGRGAFASSSAMDSHFSATYDPRTDVRPNSESEDGWDQALEALRDRQRWKQQGAQRLRSAGFTQEEVDKWAQGGEKREDDVRWAKRGEGREWDRGKVVDLDGSVDVRPEWGRLKGT